MLAKFTTEIEGCLRVMIMTVMEVIFIMPEILLYGLCLEFEESFCENNSSINSTVKSFSDE